MRRFLAYSIYVRAAHCTRCTRRCDFRTLRTFRRGKTWPRVALANDHGATARREPTPEDWQALVDEFEERALARDDYNAEYIEDEDVDEDLIIGPQDNPGIAYHLPVVEAATMTAVTASMWRLGRLLQLDGWFQLLYAFPTVFVTLRWGIVRGVHVVVTTMIWITFTLGPISTLSFISAQGAHICVLSAGLWYGWPYPLIVALSVLAKTVGLYVLLGILSLLFAMDVWTTLSKQAHMLIGMIVKAVGGPKGYAPTLRQIEVVVFASFLVHSIIFSCCSLLCTTLLLDRFAKHLKRPPPLPAPMRWLKRKANERYRQRYGMEPPEADDESGTDHPLP